MDYSVASSLLLNQKYSLYLSQEEGQVFEKVLKKWNEFVKKPIELLSKPEFAQLEYFREDDGLGALLVTSRIRSMLFEQTLSCLYPLPSTGSLIGKDTLSYSMEDIPYSENAMIDVPRGDAMPEENSVAKWMPLDDMYYTLDYDHTLLPHAQDHEPVSSIQQEPVRVKVGDDDLCANMKCMFKLICQETNDPDRIRYLKKLILEVKPSRSKWANDDKMGQESLYHSFEKVLRALRGWTEHSLPFLKPVQRKEAPTYHDVIKYPMDLGTVSRKLRAFQYTSKEQFTNDLNLIWSNCLAFNTHPDSVYRKHASAMKRKAGDLLRRVPDIVVEKDDESEYDAAVEEVRMGNKSRKTRFIPRDIVEEGSVAGSRIASTWDAKSESMAPDSSIMDMVPGPSNQSASSVVVTEDVDMNENEVDMNDSVTELLGDDEPNDDPHLPLRIWKKITYQYRLNNLVLKHYDRTGHLLGEYYAGQVRYHVNNQKRRQHFLIAQDDLEENSFEQDLSQLVKRLFLPEIMFSSCGPPRPPFPNVEYPGDLFSFYDKDDELIPPAPLPSLSEYASLQADPKSIISIGLDRNRAELKKIREAHGKILHYQNNTLATEPNFPSFEYVPAWKQSQLPPLELNHESQLYVLRKPCAILLSNAGFETVAESAMDVLVEIASKYLFNLARTIRVYLDDHGHAFSAKHILIAALANNGLDDPEALKVHVQTEIVKYGSKLYELRRKLEVALTDVEASVDGPDQDLSFDENDQEIMSGNMFEGLGVDFLNVGDLNLGFSKIPPELWNKKSEKPIKIKAKRVQMSEPEEVVTKLLAFPKWIPVDPTKQIGLLTLFYGAKADLTEEEDAPKTKEKRAILKLAQYGLKPAPKKPKKA